MRKFGSEAKKRKKIQNNKWQESETEEILESIRGRIAEFYA